MTRRFTLILAMLLSFTLGAVAQQVASSPTTIGNLTSGYYVIRVSSDNGYATASYLYASDEKVYFDAKGSEKTLAGNAIDANTISYLFYVTKNDNGTLYIRQWNSDKLYWPTISEASNGTFGVVGKKEHPGDQTSFGMNKNKGEFTAIATGDAYFLRIKSSYLNNKKAADCDGFVTLRDNSNHYVGYNDEHSTNWNVNDKAKVQFYAVSNEPRTNKSFTYNFTTPSGTVLKSETHNILFSNAAYPAYSSDWSSYFAPYYINVPAVPSGKVKADVTSYTVTLSQATLPFETDKYYYFGTAGSNPVMLSNKDGEYIAYRSKAQAEVINDIEKDLWYVTGNVFDGFQFYNVSAGLQAMSQSDVRKTSYTQSKYEKTILAFKKAEVLGTACKEWDIKKSTNGFLVFTHRDDDGKTGEDYNRFWSYSDNAILFNHADGTVKEFALYEPEFEFPLVAVGDASYNSVAFPFAAQLADETTKMYKGKIVDNVLDAVEITALPASPAGAVLVNGAKAAKAKFVAVKEVAALDNTDFIGTTSAKTQEELSNYLIFGGDASTGEVGFYSCSAKGLSANRAYLPKPTSNTKSLTIRIGGESTGIAIPTEINSASANAPVYDLSGRRVTSTIKGHLYIQNGRKFIAE